MSDNSMSDSEDGDFSASEDEWLPGKEKGAKTSGAAKSRGMFESESDDETGSDGSNEDAQPVKGKSKPALKSSGARNQRAAPKSRLTAEERTRLYEKYRSSPSTAVKATKANDSDSDSGDEHLVNADQLDLNSDFFTEPPAKVCAENAPRFDCDAGMRLSDSSGEDEPADDGKTAEEVETAKRDANKKLIAKINKDSQSFVNFEGLTEFNRKIELAKAKLAATGPKEGPGEGPSGVSDLLAMGEQKAESSSKGKSKARSARKKDESDEDDWEDVEDKEGEASRPPPGDVEITVDVGPSEVKKKKRCNEIDVEACIKRIINRDRRENQLVLHKVSILMAIGQGNYINTSLNSTKLLSIALSLIPSQKCYPKDRTSIEYFEQITKYYGQIVDLKDKRMFHRYRKVPDLETALRLQMLTKAANCRRDYILIFIILLRAIGVQCRMVISLAVAPKKTSQSELQISPPKQAKVVGTGKTVKADHDYEAGSSKSSKRKSTKAMLKIPQLDGNDDTASVPVKKARSAASKAKSKPGKETPAGSSKSVESPSKDSKPKLQEICMFSPRKTRKQRQEQNGSDATGPKKPKLAPLTPPKASSSTASSSTILIRKNYKAKAVPTKDAKPAEQTKPAKKSDAKPTDKKSQDKKARKEESSPVEKVEKPKKPSKASPIIVKVEYVDKRLKRLDRRILSTDDEGGQKGQKPSPKSGGANVWIEAYAEEEEQWVPIDAISGKVHCLEHVVKQASSPLVYILAWNNDGTIKDVSTRYCANYVTSTKKLRIEEEWLAEALAKFKGKPTARDIEEDRALNRALLEQPLPKSIGEFKNHPLYALKRHLLKFEAIYPPDAPTLGFIREEPVYARECVQTLHSREIWLKQARTVKLFETAYKVVNARPKYDRASGQMLPAQPLELFGYWQTQDYEPPTAEDGIVPRNAYGNVELFKPCMLPKKTVHLQLPGLNRICKKLRIDCAQAVTGFDFHGGSSHPVYDGFVVCEEFRDLVVDAWHEEQIQEEKREQEKYEKRVYGNWKKLIKGLLIRRRLQNKYNFDNLSG
uniref:Putative dna repair protein complementing xp-c cells n=1 Tax=Culex tarsalis TaxID=7177 RepID=A0A1Q3G1D3_CULTA